MRIRVVANLVALILTGTGSAAKATQADIDAEIKLYATSIKGNNYPEQRKIMTKLEWAGHSSPQLYDVIAQALRSRTNSKNADENKQAAWYAKSLATSGNEKYRALLQDAATNANGKNVRKYAEIGLARIDQYRAWNPVLAQGLVQAPAGRLEQTRIANMLQAQDITLLKIGAKRVYYEFSNDADLVEKTKQRLSTEWHQVDPDNGHHIDAVAWLIKALGQAADTSSKPLLSEIKDNSKIKKVRNYAKKVAKKLT